MSPLFRTLAEFQRTIRRYIPEDRTLHNHRCQNFESYKGRSGKYCNQSKTTVVSDRERKLSMQRCEERCANCVRCGAGCVLFQLDIRAQSFRGLGDKVTRLLTRSAVIALRQVNCMCTFNFQIHKSLK
jgi:hypothetical protein